MNASREAKKSHYNCNNCKKWRFSSLYVHDLKGILYLQIKHHIYLNDINCTSSILIITQQS